MSFKEYLIHYSVKAGFSLTPAQLEQFDKYFQMLIEKNQVMNLTAITEPKEVVIKHMLDSLLVYKDDYCKSATRVCDLGTGAGFPGIPLKIYQPQLQITLLDSLGKRLKWLDEVITALQLSDIHTCHARAEDVGTDRKQREQYDLVVSRAVARLSVLAEYCLPLVKVGGYFAAMKASSYEQEITDAKQALKILGGEIAEVKSVQLPDLDDKRVIIYIKKIVKTPAIYPRRAGIPDKNPL